MTFSTLWGGLQPRVKWLGWGSAPLLLRLSDFARKPWIAPCWLGLTCCPMWRSTSVLGSFSSVRLLWLTGRLVHLWFGFIEPVCHGKKKSLCEGEDLNLPVYCIPHLWVWDHGDKLLKWLSFACCYGSVLGTSLGPQLKLQYPNSGNPIYWFLPGLVQFN